MHTRRYFEAPLTKGEGTPCGRRLTSEEIRNLGGLRNATRLLRDYRSSGKRSSADSFTRGYRKQKKTPEEIAAEKENVGPAGNNPRHLKNLYEDDAAEIPPRFVIDGYNVLAEMVKQESQRFQGLELCYQRELMEWDIRIFNQMRRVCSCIVYDAARNDNPVQDDARLTEWGVDIVFCKSYEADTGLKVESDRYIWGGTPSVTVVTSDQAARDACSQPPRICFRSADNFAQEVRECRRELEALARTYKKPQLKTTLSSTLSEDELAALRDLRDDLDK